MEGKFLIIEQSRTYVSNIEARMLLNLMGRVFSQLQQIYAKIWRGAKGIEPFPDN